jgi:hypothetical protein
MCCRRDLASSNVAAVNAMRTCAGMTEELNASNHVSGSLTVRARLVDDDEMVRLPTCATVCESVVDD